jgi:predicted DCC family thiol-disulfide oxidoreductase YuxK
MPRTVQDRGQTLGQSGVVLGVVLYDGGCGFCSRWTLFWKSTLLRHGFTIARLQEPWVAEQLHRNIDELLNDIRLLTPDGQLISGEDVYLYVARKIWWAWPFYAIFSLPGFNRLMHAGYRWFARNRHRVSATCGLEPGNGGTRKS